MDGLTERQNRQGTHLHWVVPAAGFSRRMIRCYIRIILVASTRQSVDDGAAGVACADGAFHAACCSRDEAALMLQCYLLRENELLPRKACDDDEKSFIYNSKSRFRKREVPRHSNFNLKQNLTNWCEVLNATLQVRCLSSTQNDEGRAGRPPSNDDTIRFCQQSNFRMQQSILQERSTWAFHIHTCCPLRVTCKWVSANAPRRRNESASSRWWHHRRAAIDSDRKTPKFEQSRLPFILQHVVSFSKPNGDDKKRVFFLSSKRGSSFVSGPSSVLVERGK